MFNFKNFNKYRSLSDEPANINGNTNQYNISNQLYENLIFNGGFQNNNPLLGWTTTSNSVQVTYQSGISNDIRLLNTGDALSQTVQTELGRLYTLNFDAMQFTNNLGTSHDDVVVYWNGEMAGRITPGTNLATWTLQVWGMGHSGGDTLSFGRATSSHGYSNGIVGPVIDNVGLEKATTTVLSNQVIVNGSFEYNGPGSSGVEGWQWNSSSVGRVTADGTRTASNGTKLVNMDITAGTDSVSQTVQTVSGQRYLLTLDASQDAFPYRSPYYGPGGATIEVLWNGQVVDRISPSSPAASDLGTSWTSYIFTVTGTGNALGDVLTFREVSAGTNTTNDSVGLLIDNVGLAYIQSSQASLITNGSFEDGSTIGVNLRNNVNSWKSNTTSGIIEVRNNSVGGGYASDSAVHLDSTSQLDTLDQTVRTLKGSTYSLHFAIAGDNTNASATAMEGIEVWWNGQFVQKVMPNGYSWQDVSISLVGTGNAAGDVLSFRESNFESGNLAGARIDQIDLTLQTPFAGVMATGTLDDDVLIGGAYQDNLNGSAGNDTLKGLGGDDYLVGGFGNDRLEGGLGDDTLVGGKGADVFVAEGGRDTVLDFSVAEGDKIDLTALSGFDAEIWPGFIYHEDYPLASFVTIQSTSTGTEVRYNPSAGYAPGTFSADHAIVLPNVYWTQADLSTLVYQGTLVV